ncbi:DUF768 domain-containing protein [Mesorhizobium sp. B2-8-5]|uniref:DUF768 domain-containing protein n=1 Tax=Mesorhizobium sp. B2-8-5 TaxID=2589903 RepID=UPI00112BCA58|nr:DUF768 domain-containing protein [Mesorhizobium sp. B2-8-5]UCI24849.1 DUF768 domain-containing protein [Mesorhizobium sp. B2-8-5]
MRGNVSADFVSVAELTTKLFADARPAGIAEEEIEVEGGSAYEAIQAAIVGSEHSGKP